MSPDRDPSKGDEYHHPDGTVEIVFAVEGDRLLTVREYQSADFADAVREAVYQGCNEDVAGLPPAEVYRDRDPAGDDTDP